MLGFFYKGSPIMSPLLVLSVVALTVVLERLIFFARNKARRSAADVDEMFTQVERGDLDAAANMGITSRDFVARARVCAHAPRALIPRGNAALGKLGAEAL